MTSWVWIFRNRSSLLISYFVHPWFACRTLKNPKILFSLHRATRTSRVMWCNLFGHRSVQSALFSSNDQNAPSQPKVDRRSNKVKILKKKHFSWFFIKPELFRDFWQLLPSLTRSWSRVGPKALILIKPSEWAETNAITKIIKFSFQWLFMGWN